LDTALRSTLPLIATALLAALFLVRGILHPQLNYDAIPYAALAKQVRGDGGKEEAYREIASKVGSSGFQNYVSGPYRERMYRDDRFFRLNMPLYTIRPFYILLCSGVGSLTHSDIAATYLVSAVAASLAVLLSYGIGGIAGLTGNWRLAVPLTWIVAGGLNMARLSTPDALETLVSLLFLFISMTGPWKRWRAVCLIFIAILMVTTRTDAVLLVSCLMLLEWLFERRHRLVAILVFLGALSTYVVIQQISGNYGYIALLNFVLDNSPAVVPDLLPHIHSYIRLATHQILYILGEHSPDAVFLLAVSMLAVVWNSERTARAAPAGNGFNQRALILSAALTVYLVARFALFPISDARYMMTAYVLAGILFARFAQPAPAARNEPMPGSAAL
jgi:hypothetical protein